MNGKYLTDTNVIIKLLKSDKQAIRLFDDANRIYIPVTVVGELFYGAQNSSRKEENMSIFTDFLSNYAIVNIDTSVANMYGEIKVQLKKDGITIPENDLWIAATAKAKQYTLMSFDSHFNKVYGLQVVS